MKLLNCVIGSALLLALTSAYGGTALSDMHPEEAYPENLPLLASPGPYAPLIEEVQQKLHERGFDAGPANGAFGSKTQAALAQFQLAHTLPASGMLDDDTLRELGVARNTQVESTPDEQSAQGGSEDSGMSTRSGASGSTSRE
jgi:peptidoglycan hydrolase-like protein with peptidoglycan-binding domain